MKISACDEQLIDDYLLNRLPPDDRLVCEARLLLQPEMQQVFDCQQHIHQVVRQRGQQQLRKQIKQIELQLFTAPLHLNFRQKVLQWFK